MVLLFSIEKLYFKDEIMDNNCLKFDIYFNYKKKTFSIGNNNFYTCWFILYNNDYKNYNNKEISIKWLQNFKSKISDSCAKLLKGKFKTNSIAFNYLQSGLDLIALLTDIEDFIVNLENYKIVLMVKFCQEILEAEKRGSNMGACTDIEIYNKNNELIESVYTESGWLCVHWLKNYSPKDYNKAEFFEEINNELLENIKQYAKDYIVNYINNIKPTSMYDDDDFYDCEGAIYLLKHIAIVEDKYFNNPSFEGKIFLDIGW